MKLLLTDIDGSLLPFGQPDFSPALVEFLRMLPTHGIQVTFASGKPFARALRLAKVLGITTPLICANGALIKDPVTGETLFREPIDEQTVREVFDLLAKDHRCQLYPETDKGLFFLENPAIPKGQWRHDRPGWSEQPTAYDPTQDFLIVMGEAPHKIAVSTAPADRETIETLIQEHFGDRLNIFHPKPDMIDLTPKNVDKGTATEWLANRMGVGKDDLIALGDELNDLPLFAATGHSLAREHAPPSLLKRADLVVGAGDEALILALKQFFHLTETT